MEVDFSILKRWRLICVVAARHGHHHVLVLWRKLRLAHGSGAAKIHLSICHLNIR